MAVNPPKRLRPGLLIAVTIVALLAGGAVVASLLFLEPFLRDRIVEEARKRGILLEPGDVDVWFGSASVHDARFRLIDVPGVQGSAKTVDVVLSGLSPTRVVADGVQVDAVGSASNLLVDVTEWAKNHPQALSAPASARNVGLTLRAKANQEPWLVLRDGQLTEGAGGSIFNAGAARVAGIDVGSVGASWTANDASVRLGLGASGEDPPIRVDIAHAEKPPKATIQLKPTKLSALSTTLGVPLPLEGQVLVSGTAEMAFVESFERGPVHGKLAAALDGFVPPHPVELDGFVFGNRTTFASTFALSEDRATVSLTDSEVRAGEFRLKGGGKIEHVEDHGVVQMDLSGSLPCVAVADSAARARLGSVLGRMLGDTAKRILSGSVAVRVRVDADTRRLAEAVVERQIGLGCGLKPLDLRDLTELGLDRFEDLVREMPSVRFGGEEMKFEIPPAPSNLPPLPSALPPLPSALPKLPKLPFEFKFEGPKGPKPKAGKTP